MAKYQETPIEGHEIDGIKEFDNNLPRWWLYGFYFTIMFSIVYMFYYHVAGQGPSSAQEYAQEVKEAETAKMAMMGGSKPAEMKAVAILTDAASIGKGKKIFQEHLCVTCHKEDGGGLVGPNLTDNKWMHGCNLKEIMQNISTGFPNKGMPPSGNGTPLSQEELQQVASFIISLQGTNPPAAKPADPATDKDCDCKKQ